MLCKCKEECPEGQTRCRSCNAKYFREYRRTVTIRAIRKGRNNGLEAMRDRVIALFERIGERELNGRTAAELVRSQL